MLAFLIIVTLTLVCYKVEFAFPTRLKGPIYATLITKTRFITAGDRPFTVINSEINDYDVVLKNISLNTIDLDTFHEIRSDSPAITMYSDKHFDYTIHHGEDPYIIRKKRK